MKQKRIIYAIAISGLMIISASCDNFLNLEPDTFVAEKSYYKTQSQIISAVNGTYGILQRIYNASGNADQSGFLWALTEMRSDNTTFQFNTENRGRFQLEQMDEFLMSPDNNYLDKTWNNLFDGILQCNAIIKHVDEVQFSDSKIKDRSIGEAKFLRSFFYFHLVRLFGDLPLVLKPANTPEEAFTSGKVNIKKVYGQIISDAEDAIKKLPKSNSGSDIGRATSGTARILLGQVYMTRKKFSNAISILKPLTNSNYALVSSYAAIFNPSNKNNSESIFEVQYNPSESGEQNTSIFTFAPLAADDAHTLFPFPNSTGGVGMNIPTHDLVNSYEEGDQRKNASIAYYTDSETSDYDIAKGDSIAFIKKYYHPSTYPTNGEATENWPVYRYSLVLLDLAEAYNEVGETAKAYPFINRVRMRAGLEPLNGLDQEKFRQAVYHEERIEFAFENHRWYNLVRTDRAKEVMESHGQQRMQSIPRLTDDAYNIQAYKLLYPIPQREIRLNNFEQNTGW